MRERVYLVVLTTQRHISCIRDNLVHSPVDIYSLIKYLQYFLCFLSYRCLDKYIGIYLLKDVKSFRVVHF